MIGDRFDDSDARQSSNLLVSIKRNETAEWLPAIGWSNLKPEKYPRLPESAISGARRSYRLTSQGCPVTFW